MTVQIRPALDADLEGIRSIYNDAVVNTTAIWNEVAVDLANRRAWLADRTAAGFPVLVAVDAAGAVLGYASYGTWRAIDGFRHTVEHSVYVRADQRGAGLGARLLEALIAEARQAGLHVLVAAIESENQASIRLHQRFGFTITGQMPQVGRKFDRWLDLTFMQLILE
ncbi:GNAT family N-acetyltransferase [Chitinimonas taiwanensis]|jgi:phosphinothricin acetyltransferase|uniref:Phosphinothricin acetyltransferase n=1 Tax=Chitinimonas taiwanensis DSM 18899 TaxID=1121279 RepID=A0A1K2HK83_9NEIS|nr:GNAT family N-acetyltransferase [Chitinimonas taiwanensis]SFZ77232.1 phosphinothricin acetyltransferase [Chitinimonas taiwanensis DSM 18899]